MGSDEIEGVFQKFFLSLIPSGKGIFLSSFQKNSAQLIHIWKPFCQPIRRGFLLQFLTATFATEKRHDFWKKFSFNPIPQLSKPKNDIFSETFSKNVLTPLPHVFGQKTDTLFQKSFLLLYRKFFWANLNCDFEKIPLTYLDWKQNLPTLFSKKT